jgi:multiple sugar transport system substrate-binding protein
MALSLRQGLPGARARAAVVAACLVASLTVACGGGGEPGTPVLKWYAYKEPGGSFEAAAQRCTEEADGRYRIETVDLPSSADQQREQLVRRLAARDSDIDLITMDVIWTAEFAEAEWILPWPKGAAADAVDGAIPATVESGTYEDRLWAAPFTSNTQLLWYRKDLVPEPPKTWDEMIDIAERLAEEDKPHYIQVQGNRYEGYMVWFASLQASAGGRIVDGSGEVSLEAEPTAKALEVIERLATSPAADPSLPTSQEDPGRLAFESGSSAFMVNYTFVWPSAQENAPEIAEDMGWARYPAVVDGEPSRVSIGGFNLGVGAFSDHPDLAFEAATCLRQDANQVTAAVDGGLLPTTAALYDTPEVQEAFPFADVLRDTLEDAIQRPQTPAYNDVSLTVQRALHPPRSVEPEADAEDLVERVQDAVESKGLL